MTERNPIAVNFSGVVPEHYPTPELVTVPAPDSDGVLAVTQDGWTTKHHPGPKKLVETHTFNDLSSFARWLNRYGKPKETQILVGKTSVIASLHPTRSDGLVVECEMVKHPSFLAWNAAFDQTLTQKALHFLIRAHTETFLDPMQAESLSGDLLKLAVVTKGDLTHEIDATGLTKFHGSTDKTEVSGKIPSQFKLSTPVIAGVEKEIHYSTQEAKYELDVFVTMAVVEDVGPVFELSCPGLPLVTAEARVDAAAYLEEKLENDFHVLLGRYATVIVPDIHRD